MVTDARGHGSGRPRPARGLVLTRRLLCPSFQSEGLAAPDPGDAALSEALGESGCKEGADEHAPSHGGQVLGDERAQVDQGSECSSFGTGGPERDAERSEYAPSARGGQRETPSEEHDRVATARPKDAPDGAENERRSDASAADSKPESNASAGAAGLGKGRRGRGGRGGAGGESLLGNNLHDRGGDDELVPTMRTGAAEAIVPQLSSNLLAA